MYVSTGRRDYQYTGKPELWEEPVGMQLRNGRCFSWK
jgi:hypothetical protein